MQNPPCNLRIVSAEGTILNEIRFDNMPQGIQAGDQIFSYVHTGSACLIVVDKIYEEKPDLRVQPIVIALEYTGHLNDPSFYAARREALKYYGWI